MNDIEELPQMLNKTNYKHNLVLYNVDGLWNGYIRDINKYIEINKVSLSRAINIFYNKLEIERNLYTE